MNYLVLKKRMHVMSMLAMIILLSFSVGCVQQAPVENTTNVTVTPVETIPEPTTTQTTTETTFVPTKATTSIPTLSEGNRLYLESMENRLKEMYDELDVLEKEMHELLLMVIEWDSFEAHLEFEIAFDCPIISNETKALINNPYSQGLDYSHVISKIKEDVSKPKKSMMIHDTDQYLELTASGKDVLNKIETHEYQIKVKKDDIVIQKQRINAFCKDNGINVPYDPDELKITGV